MIVVHADGAVFDDAPPWFARIGIRTVAASDEPIRFSDIVTGSAIEPVDFGPVEIVP